MTKSNTALLTVLCSILSTFCIGQTQDLYKLVQGDLYHASYLYDGHDNMWGYFFLTDEGESKDGKHKFEYVVLDKNLNMIASNSFEQGMNDRLKPGFKFISKHGDSIVLHASMEQYNSSVRIWIPKINTIRVIDLNTTEASAEYLIKGTKLVKNTMSTKALERDTRMNLDLHEMGTLDYKSKFAYIKFSGSGSMGMGGYESLTLLDENFEKIWLKRLKTLNSFGPCLVEDFVVEDNQLIMSLATFKGSAFSLVKTAFRIVSLDLLTGETIFTYDLEKPDGKNMHNFSIEVTTNQINIMGSYANYKPADRYELKSQKGLFKVTLDMQGNELLKSYSSWSDVSKHIPIDEKGRIDKKFVINVLGNMSMSDGNSIFIAEKTIPQKISVAKSMLLGGAAYTKKKATDLLCFIYDKDFNLTDVKTIEKQKTKGTFSDYLFAQYSDDKSVAHFFFQDFRQAETNKQKDQWILGINTISSGELSTEEIPMTSSEHTVIPLRAKEGYILLREFNKKQKFNQLRLEKLNN